ncbi:hypothetical protein QBC33DRAFT_557604 [Phialemonium atrogriseum]|uniref:Uncharacterized protein n=1 Tax=Phialemonium atrogriseum TaxID=1093897 RepID=A0AAJ0C4A2_9PEZI|nr:uncharacterized protein QBC33DRAFT_557604 [Phialemonium atrogriseum]KAK1768843.1 hypothetical protein QBC33DRAFT_557604 [Phialemonium atrogriseum]
MKENRRPGGGYDLPVNGWDKLSKNERTQPGERLKAQQRALAQSSTACSRPLDLDKLDARLRDVSESSGALPQARTRFFERSGNTTPGLDDDVVCREIESEAYSDLVNDGGRPLYPIDLLGQVSRAAEEYREMLRPWQNPLEARKPWEVFHRQLRRWRDFRKWQNDNRGLEEDDGGFPSYVERTKLEERKWAWELEQAQRQRQRYFCREHGCDGFPDYVEAVRRRLAQHNFTRPFQLHEDPTQQDKLTTWIEYLNFECWWLDRYTRTIQRLKPDHDKAWQDLVDLKVLRPGETNESIRTDASAMRGEAEKEQAKNAVQRAKSEALRVYTLTQKEPGRSRFSRSTHIDDRRCYGQIVFGKRSVGVAQKTRDAARHTILLQWVLEQAPLIEAEMTKRETDKTGPDGATRKKRLATDEDHEEKRSLKKQKLETSGVGLDIRQQHRRPGRDQGDAQRCSSVSRYLSDNVSRTSSQRTSCGVPKCSCDDPRTPNFSTRVPLEVTREAWGTANASSICRRHKTLDGDEERTQEPRRIGRVQTKRGVKEESA